jgi:hypothetical protein
LLVSGGPQSGGFPEQSGSFPSKNGGKERYQSICEFYFEEISDPFWKRILLLAGAFSIVLFGSQLAGA